MSNKSILQSNNEALSANNLDLQDLIDQANALPDAGGVELPELTNEGLASDLLLNKQLIDDEGNVVTGTFTIDNELTAQNDLISQIQAAVDGLPEAGGGGSGAEIETWSGTVDVSPWSLGANLTVYYTDNSMTPQNLSNTTNELDIIKNTIIFVTTGSPNSPDLLNCEVIYAFDGNYVLLPTDNGFHITV